MYYIVFINFLLGGGDNVQEGIGSEVCTGSIVQGVVLSKGWYWPWGVVRGLFSREYCPASTAESVSDMSKSRILYVVINVQHALQITSAYDVYITPARSNKIVPNATICRC